MRKRIGALLAALVLLTGCGAGSGIAVVEEAPEAEAEMVKYVALTFDDGPSPRCTPRLLDGLQELGARATFFVVGCQVVKDPDIVQRMAAEGHQVGNHSYDHAALDQLTSRQALEDRKLIEKAKGILMQRDGMTEQQAFDYIRTASRRGCISMRAVAEIIAGQQP